MELTIKLHDAMQNNTIQNKHVVINNLSKWHSLQNRSLYIYTYKSVGLGGGHTVSSVGTLTEDANQPWVHRPRRKED